MVDSVRLPHIQLRDFMIASPLPLPKLLRHPSRLALKFSVNGAGEEVLSTRGDGADGIWEADGDVQICEDQLLITTIMVCVEDSTMGLGTLTVSYSQLLAHAEVRLKECYEFTVDDSTFSVLILVTCFIRTLVPPPRKRGTFTKPILSPVKSKYNEGRIGSNQALTDLERYYGQAGSFPVELLDLTDELSIDGRIPKFSGNYSYVFTGHCREEMVAIKILKEVSNKPNTMRRKLWREIHVWSDLDHPNVVRLYGYTQPGTQFGELGALISPWHPNGDAEKFLKANGSSWSLNKRTKLWHGTVAGVCYLHNHIPTIIHGDLKPGNVLIGNDGTPKLCDFGLVRIFMEEGHTELTTTSPHSGTERYLAPELLRRGAVPATASDVYALGCIGLEFLFDQRPYAHHRVYIPGLIAIDIKDGIPPATRPKVLEADESKLWALLELCWDAEPNERPPATWICGNIPSSSEQAGIATRVELEVPELTLEKRQNQAVHLSYLGTSLHKRFDRLGDIKDLEKAISYQEKAVTLTPNWHPDKPRRFTNLAVALQALFDRLGHIEDLEESISYNEKAVNLTPDGHPGKPSLLNNLGSGLKTRFDRLGHIQDLEGSISYNERALDLTPDGHPRKPNLLNSLGSGLKARFDRIGHVDDLEKAILYKQLAVELTPSDHPHKIRHLMTLGIALQTRFDRLGHIDDLEMAISYKTKAVDITPDGHPSMPEFLNGLGSALQARFDRLGGIRDIEMAIAYKTKAIDLTPDGHPSKSGYLNSLGNTIQARFDHLGRIHDLEMAVSYKTKAVEITPNDHPSMPGFLNGLGSALQARFDRLGHVEDLERAIASNVKAGDLMPHSSPDAPSRLRDPDFAIQGRSRLLDRRYIENLERNVLRTDNAVGQTSEDLNSLEGAPETRFSHLGSFEDLNDLERAIKHKKKAVEMTPDDHPDKSDRLNSLGGSLMSRFKMLKRLEDGYEAAAHFSSSAQLLTGNPRDRIKATISWAKISELLNLSSLPAYRIAIGLLPRIVWLGLPMSGQHELLQEVRGIVCGATSAAIRAEEYEIAVEWAEAGRSLTWQNLLNLRTPFNELRTIYPELAYKLEVISRQLDISVRNDNDIVNKTPYGLENPTRSHVQLAVDWDNIVEETRSRPGFESFLKPKCFNQLASVAREGPVVILNSGENQCDALVLIPDDHGGIHASSIPLPNFSNEKGEALLKELKGLLTSNHLRGGDTRVARRRPHIGAGKNPPLEKILCVLWLDVVKPVMEGLAYQPRHSELPHIWWCTTGPLTFLPIHAAGLYDTDEPGHKLSDYVVSSYTPALSTLLNDSCTVHEDFKLLVVAVADAPGASSIPHTETEARHIQSFADRINIITMMKKDATIDNVLRGMEHSNWVHLACHGQQNIKEPLKSGLLLQDGALELQRLVGMSLPPADFAFLSSCQSATGDESLAEESLHLAAGMLFAGYKGVIGTMWSIMDDFAARVTEGVYREILKDGKPNRKAAAHALHKTVQRLREDPEVDMLHWVPFIHIGR